MRIVFDFIYIQITYVIARNAKLIATTTTTKMFTIQYCRKKKDSYPIFTEFDLKRREKLGRKQHEVSIKIKTKRKKKQIKHNKE